VSLKRSRDRMDFGDAARAAARVAERVLADGLPPRTFLNVNVPRRVTHGFKVTLQAKRTHVTSISERVDPKHRPYYWIDEAQDDWEADPRSDYQAVRAGYISVTPLQPDLTAHRALKSVERLLSGAGPSKGRPSRRTGPGKKILGKARGVR
jgi:5'-nucleotidase